MVNHKAVKFNAENYSFHLGMIVLNLCRYKEACVFQNLSKILARSYRNTERVELHKEILPISARWRKSRCDLTEIQKLTNIQVRSLQISARSWQSQQAGGYLAAISLRFRNSQTSWWDLYKSWRDLGNLVEMEDISPRFAEIENLANIMGRSLQSRQDLGNLGEISAISVRWKISHHDLIEI